MNTSVHLASSLARHRSAMNNRRRSTNRVLQSMRSNKYKPSYFASDDEIELTIKIIEEMSKPNSKTKQFFELLNATYQKLILEEKEKLEEELIQFKKELDTPIELGPIKEVLDKHSISISVENNEYFDVLFNNTRIPKFLYQTFNNKFKLENWDFATLEKSKKNIEDVLKLKQSTLEKLERKLKLKVFRRSRLKEDIEYQKGLVESEKERFETANAEYELFNTLRNLSGEEKEVLETFLHSIEEKNNIIKRINENYNRLKRLKEALFEEVNKEILKNASKIITADKSNISLLEILRTINDIEKNKDVESEEYEEAEEDEYEETSEVEEKSLEDTPKTLNISNIIEKFISEVYHSINLKNLEQSEGKSL